MVGPRLRRPVPLRLGRTEAPRPLGRTAGTARADVARRGRRSRSAGWAICGTCSPGSIKSRRWPKWPGWNWRCCRASTRSCRRRRAAARRLTGDARDWLARLRAALVQAAERAAHRLAELRATRRPLHRAGRHRLRVPLRPRPPPAGHRLQRRRPPARRQLLRPAGLRGPPGQLRRHRPGKAAAGALVRPRPAPDHVRRAAGAALLERVDVRVPDAAAGHADLRPHAARRDLPGRRRPADRLRPRARRAVGRLRVRLQQDRRSAQLPVPRLRRPRPRLQARSGRRRGHRAVRQRDGADGRPRVVVREPPAAGRRRAARRVRLLRGDRLHARPAAARAGERHRPLVHGPPPGDGVPRPGVPAARPADAAAVRLRPGVPGDRPAAPGAGAQDAQRLPAPGRGVGGRAARRPRRRPTTASSRPADARARGAPALQRPVPRRRHGGRRRVQPLAGPGRHPLARGPDPRLLGDVLLPPRRRDRRVLVGRAPADAQEGDQLRGDLLPRPGGVPPPRRRHRDARRDRRLARGRRRAAAGQRHQPRPHARGRSS